jgi:hypothetical protein
MTVQRGRPRGIARASRSSMGFVESRDWRRAALLIDLFDLLDAGQEVGARTNGGGCTVTHTWEVSADAGTVILKGQ